MRFQPKSASVLPVAALVCATLMGGATAAHAQGRVLVTQMYVDNCEEIGSCEFRLTCQTGSEKPVVMIPGAIATNPETVKINKQLSANAFPATVTCTLFEDDGWFGASYDEAATASIKLEAGGDYKLKLDNPKQATVELSLIVDSFQVAPPAAAPAASPAAPAAGGKAAKPPAAGPAARFLGIFRKESEVAGHAVVLAYEEPAFLAEAKRLADKGVHPADIETWTEGGRRVWGGIFRSGPDSSLIIPALDGDKFLERWTKLNNDEDMRLVDLEVYQDKGKRLFAGAFRNGNEESSLWVGQDREAFRSKWQQLVNQGVRLVDLEVYKGAGGKNVYAGVFLDAEGSYGMWTAVPWDKFLERWQKAGASGLADIESYTEDGKRLYDGVILGGGGAEEVTGPLTLSELSGKWSEMMAMGYRLVHLEVEQ
jgi:hypothetical protein